MKILLATFSFDTVNGGGAVEVVYQLANSLASRNWEVAVLTSWSGNNIKTNYVDGIKVVSLPASNLYWIGEKDKQPTYKKVIWQLIDMWNPAIYRLVRKVIVDESPDVFHSHKLRGLSPSIWNAAKSAGVGKIIHTCHDFEIVSPQGLFLGKGGDLARQQHILLKPYQEIRRQCSKVVNVVTAPSNYTMSVHQDMGFFPSAKTEIIPNTHGLQIVDIQKNQSGFNLLEKSDGVIKFLYLGRVEKEKGLDIVCEAVSRIDPEGHNLELSIAGWGSYEEEIRNKYNNVKAIKFLGAVFGDIKRDTLRKSHILIAPSIVAETFGIIITEAFAFGIPVIASNLGAFPELITEGKTGFLFEPGSIEGLTGIIKSLLKNPIQIKEMSEHCLSKAMNYTIDDFTSNYLRLYR
jgi:glycosyltransferase involved in cell wall biosynthesis